MHERGVCGCDVRFPDLFRPRVAGRGNAQGPGAGDDGGGVAVVVEEAERALPDRMGGSGKAGAKNIPALYREVLTAGVAGGSRKPEVAVRIPSFYGVEWVDEHRQLHIRGSCKCLGDFSFYQTPASYQVVQSSSVHDRREQVVHVADSQTSQGRDSQKVAMSAHPNSHGDSDTRFSRPGSLMYSHLQQVTNNQGNHPPRHAHSDKMNINQTQLEQYPISHATHANLSHPEHLGHSSSQVRSTTARSIPQRSSGAIYEVDSAKSTNQLYNFACGEGAKITRCADFQTVDFPKKEGVLPLVGLPIGAGPEGPAGLPHTGDFDYCVLHVNDLLASLGEPRALRRKSRSVSCLYEAKVTKEHCSPAACTQSDTASAESSPSQSTDASAESSDNEDGLSGDNRL